MGAVLGEGPAAMQYGDRALLRHWIGGRTRIMQARRLNLKVPIGGMNFINQPRNAAACSKNSI